MLLGPETVFDQARRIGPVTFLLGPAKVLYRDWCQPAPPCSRTGPAQGFSGRGGLSWGSLLVSSNDFGPDPSCHQAPAMPKLFLHPQVARRFLHARKALSCHGVPAACISGLWRRRHPEMVMKWTFHGYLGTMYLKGTNRMPSPMEKYAKPTSKAQADKQEAFKGLCLRCRSVAESSLHNSRFGSALHRACKHTWNLLLSHQSNRRHTSPGSV